MAVEIKPRIRYIGGYRYQIVEDHSVQTTVTGHDVDHEFIHLTADGKITIKRFYCWDGASGPAIDTKNFMRGSLVHDALYQLLRLDLLPQNLRASADQTLYEICRADGMGWFRANYVRRILLRFGGPAASPKNKRIIQVAP
jgi:hypothetical protein